MLIDSIEAARRLGISTQRVLQLLKAGRIPGATKLGGQRGIWVIAVENDESPKITPARNR